MLRLRRSRDRRFVSTEILFLLLLLCFQPGCESSRPSQAGPLPQKTLTIAHESTYLTLDPQRKNDNVTWSVIGNIFEPLVEFDDQMRLAGRLAERWENPNDLTWRFYLRRNVRFHNSKPFNAEDVAYTIRRGLSVTNAGTRPYLISVKDVKVIDPLTVDIITDRPNPVLLNRLTFIFILPASGHPEEPVQRPIGTGPYMFEREEIRGQKLILRANASYWGGKPAIERVQFVSSSPGQKLVEDLLKGDVQLVRDFPETLIPRVEQSATCTVMTHDGLGVSFVGFNLTGDPKTSPFQKLEVRRAIAACLDSEKLVAESMEGRAAPARQLVSPGVFGYDPDLIPALSSLDRARQMLRKAGLPQGFHSEVYGVDEPRLVKLAARMRELGLDVQPHVSEWSDLYEKLLHHQVPLYVLSWNCSTGDASDLLDSLLHSPDPDGGYGSFNCAGYRNQEVDHLIELSGQTLKPNERKEYLQKALVLASRDVPYIPLYSRYRHYGISKTLNWEPRRDGRLYANDMSWKQQE